MANWATIYTQRTRLPIAADPFAELFKCERFAAKLTKTSCANRHRLSKGRTRQGLSDKAVTYGACTHCPVGKAHVRGEPTPADQFAEDTTTMEEHSQQQQPEPKEYPQRICLRGQHPFQPANGTQRGCPDKNCREKYGAPTPAKTSKPPKRRRASHQPAVDAPAKHGAVPDGVVTSPAELLELAGFIVRVINTPGGQLLQVT